MPDTGIHFECAPGPLTAERFRVFIETSTIRLSVSRETVLVPREEALRCGDRVITATLFDIVDRNPNDRIRDVSFRSEVELLPLIGAIAKHGDIELLTHDEVWIELEGATMFGQRPPTLTTAPMTYVSSPFEYVRADSDLSDLALGGNSQVDFLLSIDQPRFRELRKGCGADQGDRINENQLVDAFHIWCAEEAGASHFLTCDLKLIRLVRQTRRFRPRVRVVSPSELLEDFDRAWAGALSGVDSRRFSGSG